MLSLDHVHAGYTEATVLRDVSLVVPAGRVVALLGANGAGKTTLLRTASGLIHPSAGRVLLDGSDVSTWPPHRLVDARLCHVPEGRGIFPQLTVRENLALYARDGDAGEAIALAADAFPVLHKRLDQRAGSMSGGEQQMLALARAYVTNPRLVLLDEVSMGLAPVIVHQIFEFLGVLAEKGAALLLVEQYVRRALTLADYAYVLTRGRVTFAGEPSELADEAVFRHYLAG